MNNKPVKIIIEKGRGGRRRIKLFEGNRYIGKSSLRITDNDIANIIIREPGRWHDNYLIFINVGDEGVGDLFKTFLQKNSPFENIKFEKGLIEIKTNGNIQWKLPLVEKHILEPFKQYYNIDI